MQAVAQTPADEADLDLEGIFSPGQPVEQQNEPEYRIAATPAERQAAFHLVYRSYLRSGLGMPNRHEVRITPYHLLPTTEVFVATLHHQVISTMTLIIDGRLGLPMEAMYGDEVRRRRQEGITMAEVSCLADRRTNRRRFFEVFCKLSRLLAQYGRHRGVDQLLIVCHPKHGRFYERYLGFQPIGGLTECPHAENNPAVAMCLDFDYVDEHKPSCWDNYFGNQIPAEQLEAESMSDIERAHLQSMIDSCFQPLVLNQLATSSDGMAFATV